MLDSLKQAYLPETRFPEHTIDESKCTKCGRCYQACPTYGIRWEKDTVPVPVGYGGLKEACLNCRNCQAVCPADAIHIDGCYAVLAGRYESILKCEMRYPDPLSTEGEKEYQEIEEELTAVERVIYTRRSNRLFKDKDVPEETINRVLEAGRFAPSAGNCQPYRFIVLTNQELIRGLEKKSMKALRAMKNFYMAKGEKPSLIKRVLVSLGSYFKVGAFDQRPITAMEKGDQTGDCIYYNAPAVIMILKDKRGISNPDLDNGICTQNMVLAAHSLGLGTCYISLPMEPLKMPLMAGFRKKLGIPSRFEAVTSLALGYPKGKIDSVVRRDTPVTTWFR